MKWLKTIIVLISIFVYSSRAEEDAASSDNSSKFVVLISIDGLRPDALSAKNSPNIWKLIEGGSFYANAKTIPISVTYPAHASMLTGLRATKHKIYSNPTDRKWPYIKPFGFKFVKCKTIFHYTKKMGAKNIFIANHWYFWGFLPANPYLDKFLVENRSWDSRWTTEKTIKALRKFQGDGDNKIFTFAYYGALDEVGHKYGWMSEDYLETLRTIDEEVEKTISFIEEKKYDDRTYFIVTADHGGKGKSHFLGRKEDKTIPIIIKGPNIRSGFKPNDKARIVDITPTILYLFGADEAVFKNFDGKVLEDIFKL